MTPCLWCGCGVLPPRHAQRLGGDLAGFQPELHRRPVADPRLHGPHRARQARPGGKEAPCPWLFPSLRRRQVEDLRVSSRVRNVALKLSGVFLLPLAGHVLRADRQRGQLMYHGEHLKLS